MVFSCPFQKNNYLNTLTGGTSMFNWSDLVQVFGVIFGLLALLFGVVFGGGVVVHLFKIPYNLQLRRQLYPDLIGWEFWWRYSEPMGFNIMLFNCVMTTILTTCFLWLGPPKQTTVYKDYLHAGLQVIRDFNSTIPWGLISISLISLIVVVYGMMAIFKIGLCSPRFRGGPLDLKLFNERFVSANQALSEGTTDGLKKGISLMVDSLEVAGEFARDVIPALRYLRCALSHHDRADTKGPWNRDLSGYGLYSWWNDQYDRDKALRLAWPHILSVNRSLNEQGLGWSY
jgi:hypothetical protein